MASRDISATLLRVCFGACRKQVTPSKLLTWVLEEMASAQRDLDKTGDVDSAYYYEGMVDAFEQVAIMIAPIKDGKGEEYCNMLGKIWKPPVEEATAA